MDLQHKALAFELKAGGEEGVIEGYGSVFNVVDGHGDKVMPGAFAESLRKRMPKMLWQHRMDEPIGVWTEAREDSRGLWLRGKMAIKSEFVRDKYERIKAGALDGLSIGYVTREDEDTGEVRNLKRVDLYEVSPVTIGSNEEALIAHVKNGVGLTVRDIEQAFRNTIKESHGVSNSAIKAMAGDAMDRYEHILREAGVTGPEYDQREVGELKKALEKLLEGEAA